jgi:hypothetical protein
MNLIKSIKHQIALSVIRRWFLEGGNRFLGKDGRPVAGLNEFSKYLWEVGYRESLGFASPLCRLLGALPLPDARRDGELC